MALYDTVPGDVADASRPYAVTLFDFTGEAADELSFGKDEIVELIGRVNEEWLEGRLKGKTGIFPVSFVQVIIDLPGGSITPQHTGEPMSEPSMNYENLGEICDQKPPSIGYALVKHSFPGSEPQDLPAKEGETLEVLGVLGDTGEWVECYNGLTTRRGIIPTSFLELYINEEVESSAFAADWDAAQTTTAASVPATSSVPASADPWATSATSANDAFQPPRQSQPQISPASMATRAAVMPRASDPFAGAWFNESELLKGVGGGGGSNAAAPPRPPPPKVGTPRTTITSSDRNNGSSSAATIVGALRASTEVPATETAAQAQRIKVINELIASEELYTAELLAVQQATLDSADFQSDERAALTAAIPALVAVSSELVALLNSEKGADPARQHFGAVFVSLRQDFITAYSTYFRKLNLLNAMAANTADDRLDRAMRWLVGQVRAVSPAVLDATTLVARPIQRALKYPLFLAELEKSTPITHGDHPLIRDALKQMSALAAKMNETKRRKELAKKYGNKSSSGANNQLALVPSLTGGASSGASGIRSTLSKLTLHSVLKKGTRLKYRMGSTIGIVQLTRDEQFDTLVKMVDTLERRIIRFKFLLDVYKRQMLYALKKYVAVHASVTSSGGGGVVAKVGAVGGAGGKINKAVAAQFQPLFSMLTGHFPEVDSKVGKELIRVIAVIPKKLIQKRNDKQLDFEAAKSGNKMDLLGKQRDFEALNQQVKAQLPKAIDTLGKSLRAAGERLHELDDALMAKMQNWHDSDRLAPPNMWPREVRDSYPRCFPAALRLMELDQLAGTTVDAISKSNSSRKSVELVLKDAKSKKESKKSNGKKGGASTMLAGGLFRVQTAAERERLLNKILDGEPHKLADVYVVTQTWPSAPDEHAVACQDGSRLLVSRDDLVVVVERSGEKWLCTNGVYTAPVPATILRPFSDSAADAGTSTAAATTIPEKPFVPTASAPSNNGNSVNLLDDFLGLSFGGSSSSVTNHTATPQKAPPSNPDLLIDFASPTTELPVAASTSAAAFSLGAAPAAATNIPMLDLFDIDKFESAIDWSNGGGGGSGGLSKATAMAAPNNPQQPAFAMGPPLMSTLAPTPAAPPVQSSSAAAADPFDRLWQQLDNRTPVREISRDSPMPLMPTERPQPTARPVIYEAVAATTGADDPFVIAANPSSSIYPPLSGFASSDRQAAAAAGSAAVPASSDPLDFLKATPQYDSPPAAQPTTTLSRTYDQPPTSSDPTHMLTTEQAVAGWDFTPNGINMVPLRAGERVGVVRRCDEEANSEWWLVALADGRRGYAPGAYLKPV